jgi:hypothetical protein
MPKREHACEPHATDREVQDRQPGNVLLVPPTEDQQEYLRSIERTIGVYNPDVMVGGPRDRRA